MKFLHSLLPPLFRVLFCASLITAQSSDYIFSAVTRVDKLTEVYARMRIREPHLEPDPQIDAETKKRICHSITSSGYFDKDNIGPVNMDEAYRKLKRAEIRQQKRNLLGTRHIYYKTVLEDYRKIWTSTSLMGWRSHRHEFTYRSRLITFQSYSKRYEEFAFACLAQNRRTKELYVYYVSDVYNINTALDVPTNRRIGARFICSAWWDACELDAIAEEPATAFAEEAEVIYREMREFYDPASTSSDDPLCGLSLSEKLRVCASVMNSSYFVERGVKYRPHAAVLKEECDFNKVSFRIMSEQLKAENNVHQEWMLRCTGLVEVSKDETYVYPYFVSRAYHSQHVVVYSYLKTGATETWLVGNISANVSVVVEKDLKIKESRKGEQPQNVSEVLESLVRLSKRMKGL